MHRAWKFRKGCIELGKSGGVERKDRVSYTTVTSLKRRCNKQKLTTTFSQESNSFFQRFYKMGFFSEMARDEG